MGELIDIVNTITAGGALYALILLPLYLLSKLDLGRFIELLSEANNKKQHLAAELLKSDRLSAGGNVYLREFLERESFRRLYKINADSEMRSALSVFLSKYCRDVDINDLRYAYDNLVLKNSAISVKIGSLFFVKYYLFIFSKITVIVMYYLALTAALMDLYRANQLGDDYHFSFIPILIVSAICFFSYFVLSFLLLPFFSTLRIVKALKS